MKKYLSIALFFILIYGCGTTLPTTGEVTKSSEKIDTLVLNSKGYGKTESDALKHAKIQAFTNLFFRGIPNSSYSKAMIGNEEKSRKEHKDYFKGMFKQMELNKFITEFSITRAFNKKEKSISCDISINIKALRANLIENKILREWGLN